MEDTNRDPATAALIFARRRIEKFVLWPLSLMLAMADWQWWMHGVWWAGAAYLVLLIYIAWIAAGVRFPSGNSEELDRMLASIMVKVYYALVAAAIVCAIAADLRFYWTILVAVATWILANIAGTLIMAFVSIRADRYAKRLGDRGSTT
jgi:hypothetical protein